MEGVSMPASKPSVGASVNHLVLSVRDLEASHRFYTDVLGFEQCGEMTHTMTMRFYRGSTDHHHDIALAQAVDPSKYPAPPEWNLIDMPPGINHIAIGYPDRDSWLAQLQHMKDVGVQVQIRGNHGMSHSAYITDPDGNGIEVLYNLPEEVWGGDVDAALNYFEYLPSDGDEAMQDRTDYQRFGEGYAPPVAEAGRVTTRID
jgi:catechol 2,3-dioxygenase